MSAYAKVRFKVAGKAAEGGTAGSVALGPQLPELLFVQERCIWKEWMSKLYVSGRTMQNEVGEIEF